MAVATAQQVAAYAAAVSNDEVGAMLEKLAAEAEVLLAAVGPAASPAQHATFHSLLESIILTRRSRDAGAAMTLLKKVSYLIHKHKLVIFSRSSHGIRRDFIGDLWLF